MAWLRYRLTGGPALYDKVNKLPTTSTDLCYIVTKKNTASMKNFEVYAEGAMKEGDVRKWCRLLK